MLHLRKRANSAPFDTVIHVMAFGLNIWMYIHWRKQWHNMYGLYNQLCLIIVLKVIYFSVKHDLKFIQINILQRRF